MRQHLKVHHPTSYTEIQITDSPSITKTKSNIRQLSISESFGKLRKFDRNSDQAKKITDAITKYLAMDCLPIYSVTKSGFKHLVGTLTENKYDLPSQNHFSQIAIPKLYNDTRERVMADIHQSNYFSATSDIWSSIGLFPYISLTVHYVSVDWTLESRVLETYPMPEDHTGVNIADVVEDILELWNIEKSKLISLTTDNASNMKLAGTLLGVCRIPCFGHILHNAINYALNSDDKVEKAIAACRKISGRFGMSFKKKRELSKAQRELNLPVKTIPSDNNTRWNSKYKLLCYVIEQEAALRTVLSERSTSHLLPSASKFQVIIMDLN